MMLTTILAAALSFNGLFADCGEGKLPRGWKLHDYSGYLPYARAVAERDAALGLTVVRLSEVRARQGVCLRSTVRHRVAPGTRYRFSCLARGRGSLIPGLYCYGPKGEWLAPLGSQPLQVAADWRLLEGELTVPKDRPLPVTTVEVVLDGTREGAFDIADVRMEEVPEDGALPRYREVKSVRVLASADNETAAGRLGSPEIGSTDIAPGLLQKTRVATYRTKGGTTVSHGVAALPVPSESGRAASATFRLYALAGGTLREAFGGGAGRFRLTLRPRRAPALVEGELTDGTNVVARLRLPQTALPADFRFDFTAAGEWGLDVTSLADSSVRRLTGRAASLAVGSVRTALRLTADPGGEAVLTVDDYRLGEVAVSKGSDTMPFAIERLPAFDPVKAGWPLVFEDTFDGTALDTNKWYFPHYCGRHRDFLTLDGKGHLRLKVDLDEKGRLATDGIWSTRAQRYGYFEARLKFTSLPGWWAAFWLYGPTDTNAFLDGFEIDVFEDYYTRGKADEPGAGVLDHNIHVSAPGALKSWNYNSRLPRRTGDWHVIACRWTPFEISYYMDGRIIRTKSSHSPYDTLTFDAFRHAAGLTPLHAIVSGQIQGDWEKKIDRSRLPETFEVDYVRIYAYPEPAGELPRVTWARGADACAMVPAGAVLDFAFRAEPASGTRSPVKGVYLFDNGYPIACRTEPPYDFPVRFSEDAYRQTAYLKPGRSGRHPKFDATPHVFVPFVQDAAGRVAHGRPVWRFPVALRAAPYEDRVPSVPGRIEAARFDAGGRGVSSFTAKGRNDHWDPQRKEDGVTVGRSGWVGHVYAGDWLNYTVDVAAAGRYEVRLDASFQVRGKVGVSLFCDGMPLGRLELDGCRFWKRDTTEGGALDVALPAGRHVLTVAAEGGLVFRAVVLTARR